MDKDFNADKDELEKILILQRYPVELNDDLCSIAKAYPKIGLFEVIIRAFSLGMIYGKRMERNKKKL